MSFDIAPQTLVELGLDTQRAVELSARLDTIPKDTPPAGAWLEVSRTMLGPSMPFAIHKHLYDTIFAHWDPGAGPPPAWIPSVAEIVGSNIAALCKRAGVAEIRALHRWSVENREAFWGTVIDTLAIKFNKPPQRIVDMSDGVTSPQWLPGARLNIAESCFDGAGDSTAIVHRADGSDDLERTSYSTLDRLSSRVANGLRAAGLKPGDAVAIAMPMTVEAVAAYLVTRGNVPAGDAWLAEVKSYEREVLSKR